MSETSIVPEAQRPSLTPEDVAATLGCSVWWVKKQCREQRFPCMKISGAYRFTHAHLEEIFRLLEQRPI
jgi:helix-turn-helix protein